MRVVIIEELLLRAFFLGALIPVDPGLPSEDEVLKLHVSVDETLRVEGIKGAQQLKHNPFDDLFELLRLIHIT